MGKYYCILGKIQAEWDLGEQVRFVPNKKYFQHLKGYKKGYNNMNIFFSWILPVISQIGVPSLSEKRNVSERVSSQSDKIWSQGDFKNPNFLTLQWTGKNLEVLSRLTFIKPSFSSFLWIGKNWEFRLKQHSKIPIRKNLKVQHSSFESMDELGKVIF